MLTTSRWAMKWSSLRRVKRSRLCQRVQKKRYWCQRTASGSSTRLVSASELASGRARCRGRRTADGNERTSTRVAALVDTNILVYRYDPRFPAKQARATQLLRQGIADNSIVVPHQALVEFVAAVTRPISGKTSLLSVEEAHREVDEMLAQFSVVYPTENTLRTALRGAALYKLSWFDAHLWAYADERGLDPLWSEDFEDGRLYGRVRVLDPFRLAVHEPP